MKNNFLLEVLAVLFIFLIGLSMFSKENELDNSSLSSEIGAFDDLINGGYVVEDGYLEDLDKSDYEGNIIAKIFLFIGEGITSILDKGIDFVVDGLKSVLD